MRVSSLRSVVCAVLIVTLPATIVGQALPEQSGGAILHSDGGVWVNGYEARDSSAVFPGDIIETKPGATANLSVDGSTVLLAPESVGKYDNDLFELDHGVVSVVTNKIFKIRVNCIRVIPVVNDWTKYVVADLNGTVQVSAQKLDVNVEHEHGRGKPSVANEAPQRASVHEGEQKSYDESEVCGAPPGPTTSGSGVSPKWIAAGAGGAGLVLCVLLHCFGGGSGSGSGGKPPLSQSSP
ncbi:MAG TPA: hypothetical protein VGS27_10655 [Candidatus Sulfotelmatobacter sp.]|nr:hypothetical protein [Candidatus Sulfotelmatobacter sp.]